MEKLRFAGIVLLAGIIAVGVSQGVEIFINRVLRPDATELTWIGDLVAAGGFMVMTTLVLKLKETQDVLSAMERERLVLDTQLSIAADVQRGLLPPVPKPSEKFDPIWQPHYLAYPGGLTLPRILADVSALVAGGYRKIFLK